MPATTVVANTAISLAGKTLATLEASVNFLGIYLVAPVGPPNNSAWVLYVAGPPNSVQLWLKVGGVEEYLDLGTLT